MRTTATITAGLANPAGMTRWNRTGSMGSSGGPVLGRARLLLGVHPRRALLRAGVEHEHDDADHDERVGDVEGGPAQVGPVPPVPLDEVDDVPPGDPVDEVPNRPREHEREGDLEEALVLAELPE